MANVFISYSRHEKAFVTGLQSDLSAATPFGVSCVYMSYSSCFMLAGNLSRRNETRYAPN